jgi:hypothetical protein
VEGILAKQPDIYNSGFPLVIIHLITEEPEHCFSRENLFQLPMVVCGNTNQMKK